MDASRIPVGYITRPHGIRGDVLVVPLSDHPDRFSTGAHFYVEDGTDRLTVTAVRPHKDGVILSMAELGDRTAAEAVAKLTLTIDAADRRALGDGEYWPDDLVGLRAVTASGTVLGTVTDVVLGDAQDRLVVSTAAGQRVEVPFVAALVDEPGADSVVIRPPEGLFPTE